MPRSFPWLFVAALATGAVATSCSSDPPSARSWNDQRQSRGFDRAANERATAVLRRLQAADIPCTRLQVEDFAALVSSYRAAQLPLPLGSASCTGPGGENLLVEVFRTHGYPTATDFLRRKGTLVCAKGRALGRRPDGSTDFPGLPYLEDTAAGWIIEPDSVAVNRRIAEELHLEAENACPDTAKG